MTIFYGGRDDDMAPEDRGYTPGKDARDIVVIILVITVICALLIGGWIL